MMIDSALDRLSIACLQLPCVATLVVHELRVVIAFVEIFEDAGEDLRFFVWEGDSFGGRTEELATAGSREEGREAEHVFMCCEESLFAADDEGDYGGG